MILSDNLKWNAHIGEIVRKANKWLFFLILLKNACPNREDFVVTYTNLVRPIIEYSCPVYLNTCRRRWKPFKRELWLQSMGWHHMKTIYVQVVWYPSKTDVLKFVQICRLDHKLNHLIPKTRESSKSLRNAPPIDPPKFRTNRYRDIFIPYSLMNFQ